MLFTEEEIFDILSSVKHCFHFRILEDIEKQLRVIELDWKGNERIRKIEVFKQKLERKAISGMVASEALTRPISALELKESKMKFNRNIIL
jgi:hypothetical protein